MTYRKLISKIDILHLYCSSSPKLGYLIISIFLDLKSSILGPLFGVPVTQDVQG
jgi:hypothetical protein